MHADHVRRAVATTSAFTAALALSAAEPAPPAFQNLRFDDNASTREAAALRDGVRRNRDLAKSDREHAELEDLRQAAEASRAEAERWRKAALAADEESARLREELARRPAPPASPPSPPRRNRRRGATA